MGFFSKSAAPVTARAAPRGKPAAQSTGVAITGLGLACHAGDRPCELICSVLGQISGVRLSDAHKVKPREGGANVMSRIAPVQDVHDIRAAVRMQTLAATALANIEEQLPDNIEAEKLLIVLMVNPELITHHDKIDPLPLQQSLLEETTSLDTATFRILSNSTASSSSALRTAIAEMHQGKWQAILLGGADSLISMDTCIKLNEAQRLNTTASRAGLVPGEAAAFVLLQSSDEAANNTTPTLAYLSGLGIAAEPNARNADLEATEGLTSAINQALAQAGIQSADIQGIVHSLGAETAQSLEWYQTTQAIWPRRVSEQQRMAVQLGEIKQADLPDDPLPKTILPHLTMGEVGAAAFPIQLAVALAWIAYDTHQSKWGLPVRNHLLVCDTPEAAERGAIIISTQLTSKNQPASQPAS